MTQEDKPYSLLGLGDLDIADIDWQQRESLRARNPHNQPEVTLAKWTHATLTRDGKDVGHVVCGCVTQCLTDDYGVGEFVCSERIVYVPDHPGRCIYVTNRLRYECVGDGNEITVAESDLHRLLSANALNG